MKLLMTILLCMLMPCEVFATDYLVEDGDMFGLLKLTGYDTLLMTGGEVEFLDAYDHSLISLHGGQIIDSLWVEDTTSWVHVYGYGFRNTREDHFQGFWADGTPFTIKPIGGTYGQIVLHEVPEPSAFCLMGLSGLFLRKR